MFKIKTFNRKSIVNESRKTGTIRIKQTIKDCKFFDCLYNCCHQGISITHQVSKEPKKVVGVHGKIKPDILQKFIFLR